MIRETGTLIKTKGKTAVVSVDKSEKCAGCGLCLFKNGTTKAEFYVSNEIGAKVGDVVVIERSETGGLLGAVLAFFVPLLLIGLAVVIDFLFIGKEILILILSAAFIAAWFSVLGLIEGRLKNGKAFRSRITEISSAREENAQEKE